MEAIFHLNMTVCRHDCEFWFLFINAAFHVSLHPEQCEAGEKIAQVYKNSSEQQCPKSSKQSTKSQQSAKIEA